MIGAVFKIALVVVRYPDLQVFTGEAKDHCSSTYRTERLAPTLEGADSDATLLYGSLVREAIQVLQDAASTADERRRAASRSAD